jgi:putative transposase
VRRYDVPVYGYSVTSNHVHLIVHADDRERVGLMMHLVAGAFAQQRNRRKGHEGSVWEHPYQCTVIQDGQHLLNCLRYVSLNMVRAGVVRHPSQWRWCGHDELTGQRRRYRILDLDRLVQSLAMDSVSDMQTVYQQGIEDALARRELGRVADWTEALAVGDRVFVERVARDFDRRNKFLYSETAACADGWAVRETAKPYSSP